MAFVAVKGEFVPDVADACKGRGVRGPVVISAGVRGGRGRGTTTAGGARADPPPLGDAARGSQLHGGGWNTDADVALNGTFASIRPRPGPVGLLSQSGAVGIAVMIEAERRDLGLSSFVSVGNKADISGNDLLSYWEEDERTSVALLYLESFGNPRGSPSWHVGSDDASRSSP